MYYLISFLIFRFCNSFFLISFYYSCKFSLISNFSLEKIYQVAKIDIMENLNIKIWELIEITKHIIV